MTVNLPWFAVQSSRIRRRRELRKMTLRQRLWRVLTGKKARR